jgi:hypothetical protein
VRSVIRLLLACRLLIAPKGEREKMKISVVESSSIAVSLRVEGRLTGGWVEELRRACDLHALSAGVRLTLDLADVSFADVAGIELLRELRVRMVTLLNPSSLVAEQLNA